jgi:hypothetical protein
MEDSAFERACDLIIEEWEEEVESICKGYMDKLYKDLENQYEFITSMEEFIECSRANEWVYDEDGDLI